MGCRFERPRPWGRAPGLARIATTTKVSGATGANPTHLEKLQAASEKPRRPAVPTGSHRFLSSLNSGHFGPSLLNQASEELADWTWGLWSPHTGFPRAACSTADNTCATPFGKTQTVQKCVSGTFRDFSVFPLLEVPSMAMMSPAPDQGCREEGQCRDRQPGPLCPAVCIGHCSTCGRRQSHSYLLVIPVHFHFFGKVFHETLKSYSFFGAEHLQGRSRRPCRKQTDSDQEKWHGSRQNTKVQRQGTLLCPASTQPLVCMFRPHVPLTLPHHIRSLPERLPRPDVSEILFAEYCKGHETLEKGSTSAPWPLSFRRGGTFLANSSGTR